MLATGCHFKDYEGYRRISISNYDPKNRKVNERIPELAPTKKMLKMGASDYNKEYRQILERADQNGIIQELVKRAKDEDIVLLCWEHKPERCHRQTVARFIANKYKIVIPEAGKKEAQLNLL